MTVRAASSKRTAAPKAKRVLIVGLGGLGLPVADLLAADPRVASLTLLDDDLVDATNLHRQTLYDVADVGARKVEVAAKAIERRRDAAGSSAPIIAQVGRFVPGNALALLEGHDLIVEGADNLATKFLAADAAAIAGKTCVQAGVTRWNGWAMASFPDGGPCLRCLFEDIPSGTVESCTTAGVLGPVVGVVAALQAALAIGCLRDTPPRGVLYAYHGLEGSLRRIHIERRVDCPLCAGEIHDLDAHRYIARGALPQEAQHERSVDAPARPPL